MSAKKQQIGQFAAIGSGVYTLPDTARILRLPKERVRRWATGYWKLNKEGVRAHSKPVVEMGIWGEGNSRALNFFALIEIFTFTALRELGISLPKIRKARDELIKRFGTSYPFANHELLCDGRQIFVSVEGAKSPVLMYLGKSGQTALKEIVEPFCRKLDFCSKTKLAQRYWPLGKDRKVVVDPHHGFGRPTISGTNITSEAIVAMVSAGESREQIADMYELEVKAIEDALDFELKNAA